MKIQRYVQVISMRDGYIMRQDEKGDYVKYSDVVEYVKAVREECAKIAEKLTENVDDWDSSMDKCSARKLTIIEIANEIRALNKD